jgi:uncharacterized protein YbjT (DUF2867 family)
LRSSRNWALTYIRSVVSSPTTEPWKTTSRSGIPYTFLRPNLFLQGFLHFRSTIVTQGAFYIAAGNAKVSIIDVPDIASVAVQALTKPGHEGKVYEITGPDSLTHAEMANLLSEATGRTVKYVDISPDAMRQALLGVGMPPWQRDGLVEEYELYRRGEASKTVATVEEVTGAAPRTFAQFACDYAKVFPEQIAGAA